MSNDANKEINDKNENESTFDMEAIKDMEGGMKKINEAMNSLKVACPVHKINFKDDDNSSLVGMYLMTLPDVDRILDGVAQMDDLEDDTWLYFEPRHIMEMAETMWICCRLMAEQKFISQATVDKFVSCMIDEIHIMKYKDFRATLKHILEECGITANTSNPMYARAYNNFTSIFHILWFVPYAQLDDIAKEFISDMIEKQKKQNEAKSEETNNE